MFRSSSESPKSRQYSSQLAAPSGGGAATYPRAAAQNRDSRSGLEQSITSVKPAAIVASGVGFAIGGIMS